MTHDRFYNVALVSVAGCVPDAVVDRQTRFRIHFYILIHTHFRDCNRTNVIHNWHTNYYHSLLRVYPLRETKTISYSSSACNPHDAIYSSCMLLYNFICYTFMLYFMLDLLWFLYYVQTDLNSKLIMCGMSHFSLAYCKRIVTIQ